MLLLLLIFSMVATSRGMQSPSDTSGLCPLETSELAFLTDFLSRSSNWILVGKYKSPLPLRGWMPIRRPSDLLLSWKKDAVDWLISQINTIDFGIRTSYSWISSKIIFTKTNCKSCLDRLPGFIKKSFTVKIRSIILKLHKYSLNRFEVLTVIFFVRVRTRTWIATTKLRS